VPYLSALGVKTLRTQDTSDPRHFGTSLMVPKCPDSSALVPKCLSDTSALVPNCLDLKHTFLVYLNLHAYNIAHLLLSSGVCVYFFGYFLQESEMIFTIEATLCDGYYLLIKRLLDANFNTLL